jgi:hypothetical protein
MSEWRSPSQDKIRSQRKQLNGAHSVTALKAHLADASYHLVATSILQANRMCVPAL